eukprot:TRINITY_DN1075_c0_g2_i1.p1 TRINITY_DN1075_c0_g2~~TRINITY_DN1075_c0_g2_i1.p1  ORF type:complete len:140 (-),score=31.88 TRINITY_DN1075_c0_g2_i1:15-434(-)
MVRVNFVAYVIVIIATTIMKARELFQKKKEAKEHKEHEHKHDKKTLPEGDFLNIKPNKKGKKKKKKKRRISSTIYPEEYFEDQKVKPVDYKGEESKREDENSPRKEKDLDIRVDDEPMLARALHSEFIMDLEVMAEEEY